MIELKPCPFCGSKDLYINYEDEVHYVICQNMNCVMQGPVDLGESGAIEKWNTRPGERAAAVAGWEWRDYRPGSLDW